MTSTKAKISKKDIQEAMLVRKLIIQVQKDIGRNCKEVNLNCSICQAYRLIEYLKWYLDLIV